MAQHNAVMTLEHIISLMISHAILQVGQVNTYPQLRQVTFVGNPRRLISKIACSFLPV